MSVNEHGDPLVPCAHHGTDDRNRCRACDLEIMMPPRVAPSKVAREALEWAMRVCDSNGGGLRPEVYYGFWVNLDHGYEAYEAAHHALAEWKL